MTVQILKRAAPLAAVLLGLGGGAAWAGEGAVDAMPLGDATSAPVGFLEMCEREPGECLSVDRPTDAMLSDVRTWAGRARWSAVFQAAGIASAPAALPASVTSRSETPAAMVAQPLVERVAAQLAEVRSMKPTVQDIRARKDRRRKQPRLATSKTPPAPAAPSTPVAPIVTGTAPEPTPARVVADVTVRDLETVTRRINRSIRRASDADAYGREDMWVLPQGPRPSGDCEDYVLAKRQVLIQDGVDPAALSIAIVRTRWGELHAVLLVATSEGERVLDNLTPWVLPWREAPYEWLERQAPGQPLMWVRAAT